MERGGRNGRPRRRTIAFVVVAGAALTAVSAVQATAGRDGTATSRLPVSAPQHAPPRTIDVAPAGVAPNVGPFTVGQRVHDGDVEPSCDFPSRGWGADWQPRQRLNRVSFSAAVNTEPERPVHFTGIEVHARSVGPSHHPSLLYCPPDTLDSLPVDTHVYTARIEFDEGEPDVTYIPLQHPGKVDPDELDPTADPDEVAAPPDVNDPGNPDGEVDQAIHADEQLMVILEATTTGHTEVVWDAEAVFEVAEREVRVPVAPDQGPFVVSDGGEGANALLWNGEQWEEWRPADPPESPEPSQSARPSGQPTSRPAPDVHVSP